jgi:tetratricopeptide (TPR) repeat protein
MVIRRFFTVDGLCLVGAGYLLTILGPSLALASESRVIGSDNSYFVNGSKSSSKHQPKRAKLHTGRPQNSPESGAPQLRLEERTPIKGKMHTLNAGLLEEQIPEIASLIEKNRTNPEDPDVHFALAACYHSRGVLDKALDEYQRAIQLNPGRADYHEALARLWHDGGVPKSSIEELQVTLQLNPGSVSAWNLLGTLYDDQGNLTQALNCYKKALSQQRDLDYLHSNLCFAYLRTGQIQYAILHGEEAIRLNPNNKVAHNNLGIAYALIGNQEMALGEFRQAGDVASAHNNLGLILLNQGKPDEAIEEFKIAIRLRPFYRMAAENYRLARSLKAETEKQDRPLSGTGKSKGG